MVQIFVKIHPENEKLAIHEFFLAQGHTLQIAEMTC